jgi:hypothetical protein
MVHSGDMETFEVALIPTGEARWAALLATGQVILSDTRNPRVDVAVALLRQGCDPRSELVIRSGARVVAHDKLGWIGGSRNECTDIAMMEKD